MMCGLSITKECCKSCEEADLSIGHGARKWLASICIIMHFSIKFGKEWNGRDQKHFRY